MSMNHNLHAIAAILVVVVIAGCSAGAGASASPSPSPSLSLVPLLPSPGDSATPGTSAPPGGVVSTPDEAAQRVIAEYPQFEGMSAKDPELIGGCCWYEATAVPGGFQVVMTVGWGDCPSGCINKHIWTFAVTPAGEVGLIGEEGDGLPPGSLPD